MKLSYFFIVVSLVSTFTSAARAAEAEPPSAAPAPLAPVVESTPVAPAAPAALAPRRTGMMVTGIVLTSIASLAFVGGASLTIGNFASPRGDAGPLAAIIGVPMMIGSVLFAAPGIPLWVVGAGSAAPTKRVPTISVGAESATLRWSF